MEHKKCKKFPANKAMQACNLEVCTPVGCATDTAATGCHRERFAMVLMILKDDAMCLHGTCIKASACNMAVGAITKVASGTVSG